jgi:hypothetical protein
MVLLHLLRQLRGLSDNKRSNTKIGAVKLWVQHWEDSHREGHSDRFVTRPYNQYTDGSGIYSQDTNVTYFYTIDNYPMELASDMKRLLRNKVPRGSRVRVSFIDLYEQTSIDWDSAAVRAKLNTWRVLKEETKEGDIYNLSETIGQTASMDWREASLGYLVEALRSRGRYLYRVRTLMIISGERGEVYDKALLEILEECRTSFGLSVNRINGNLEDYLEMFSPFTLEYKDRIRKRVGNFAMTDEILGQLYTYSQGKVGYDGIYWGTDIDSRFPVFKKMKPRAEDAENILITAQTGGGKSFFAKSLIFQILADDRFNGTIMDFEGNEYAPLTAFLCSQDGFGPREVITLNMAEGSGAYFDPVAICISQAGQEMRQDSLENNAFNMAKAYSKSIMTVLCGANANRDDYIGNILNEAIERTYAKVGVTDNPSTWRYSKGLTLKNIYEAISEIEVKWQNLEQKSRAGYQLTSEERALLDPNYKTALNKMIMMLRSYFSEDGINSYIFRNPIRLDEVSNARLVVCSFGMQGRSPETVDPIQMALMEIYAANISHIRSIYSKDAGKFNFKVWEEFQRWSAFAGSEATIKTALTGGRKMGDVNIIITNAVEDLLVNDTYAVMGSITSAAIGLLRQETTRQMLCERLSIPESKARLDEIANKNENRVEMNTRKGANSRSETKSDYDKAFLVYLDQEVTTVSKMYLPSQLMHSKIFKTGVELQHGN